MIYLVLYLAVFILWLTIELIRAPMGYEDEDGFHFCGVGSASIHGMTGPGFKIGSLKEG